MLARVSGRLLVSPLSFLLAGTVDFALFGVMYARWRLEQRRVRAGGRVGAGEGAPVA